MTIFKLKSYLNGSENIDTLLLSQIRLQMADILMLKPVKTRRFCYFEV